MTYKAASLVEKIRRNKGTYDSYSDSEENEPETVKVERKPLMPPKPTSLSLQRMVNTFLVKKLNTTFAYFNFFVPIFKAIER